jgi:hypothetical protein
VRPELVVAFVVETLNGRLLDGAVHPLYPRLREGRLCPLVQGWFGLVSRCSISFASQIMSKRI